MRFGIAEIVPMLVVVFLGGVTLSVTIVFLLGLESWRTIAMISSGVSCIIAVFTVGRTFGLLRAVKVIKQSKETEGVQ